MYPWVPIKKLWALFGRNSMHSSHHRDRSSRASPLCVVVQQDRWAAGAAAGTTARAAGRATGDGRWWAVSWALHSFVQAVHRPLLMPRRQRDRHTAVRRWNLAVGLGLRLGLGLSNLWMDLIYPIVLSLMSTCDKHIPSRSNRLSHIRSKF